MYKFGKGVVTRVKDPAVDLLICHKLSSLYHKN